MLATVPRWRDYNIFVSQEMVSKATDLFILATLVVDDKVDGDDEDEKGEEDSSDDGDPVDGAEAAREPLGTTGAVSVGDRFG